MPKVVARADELNAANARFEQAPLREPAFLNSVPKCGTHLLRNIVRMFVPVAQQYHDAFIQYPILRQHLAAFDPRSPRLSWGHLLFSDDCAMALQRVRHVVLVRDPYDWVLARARFFLSDTFQASLEHLKHGRVGVDEVMNMMIFGIHGKAPSLQEIFLHNAVAWLGTKVHLVKFEDLIRHVNALDTADADGYFRELLSHCGIVRLPEDWRARVEVGADRKQSGTARENLSGDVSTVPERLPPAQRSLVDYAAPGLRKILGYE